MMHGQKNIVINNLFIAKGRVLTRDVRKCDHGAL